MLTISQGAAPWLKHNLYEQCWVCNGNMNNLLLGFLFSDHTNFGDFYLFVCKGQLKMYKVLKCMCWNIILPIRISVWLYPFCCCDCCLLNLSPCHRAELYHSLFLIRVLFHPQLPSPPLLHTLACCLLAFPQHSNTFTPLLYHPLNFSLSSHFTFHLDIFKRFFLTL